MELSQPTFDQLRQTIHGLCGLVITDHKQYLVRDRLAPIVARRGWQSFEQLAEQLGARPSGNLADEVVEAIVTHETSFFRDPHIWAALAQELLPRLSAGRSPARPRVRIWSAATSTGQEAYTLAMLAQETGAAGALMNTPRDAFSILATDICPSAVHSGTLGQYHAMEMSRGISLARRERFFVPSGPGWRVCDSLRGMVEFRRLNLTEPWPAMDGFDLISCRNVLIYFDDATRRKICEQLHARLVDGGWLLLGAAENLYGISTKFTSVMLGNAMFYRKA
jgi:chemotaxis protein methyltransferase CheR